MQSDELTIEPIEITVSEQDVATRLDAFLAERFPLYSRVKLRRVINAGGVKVDGKRTKAAFRLSAGQQIVIQLPELTNDGPAPENIPLEVLYEDEAIVAINKSPGMVVHPGKGNWTGTMTSALAYHFENLSTVGGPTRPGIVHRLDRDTSGVIVVAKTDRAHLSLAMQFEQRETEKEYFAIVAGVPDRDRDVIEMPIGAHPSNREKMAIRADHTTSKHAHSFYEVEERFTGFATIRVFPKTGRTHQIRVHLAHIGCPVLCDRLYGGRSQLTLEELSEKYEEDEVLLKRQALHAARLRVQHPIKNEPIEFVAPLPDDLANTIAILRKCRR